MNNRMAVELKPIMVRIVAALGLPPGTQLDTTASGDTSFIKTNWPDIFEALLVAYSAAVGSVFWLGCGCAALCALGALAMQHIPLKDGLDATAMHMEGGAQPPPPVKEAAAEAPAARSADAAASGDGSIKAAAPPLEDPGVVAAV